LGLFKQFKVAFQLHLGSVNVEKPTLSSRHFCNACQFQRTRLIKNVLFLVQKLIFKGFEARSRGEITPPLDFLTQLIFSISKLDTGWFVTATSAGPLMMANEPRQHYQVCTNTMGRALALLLTFTLWYQQTRAWSHQLSCCASSKSSRCESSKPIATSFGRRGFLGGIVAVAAGTLGAKRSEAAVLPSKKEPYIYQPLPGSLVGKMILITGGSTGLGLESAKRLAAAGATIVLTTRTLEKGEKAVANVQDYVIQKGVENSNVYFLTLDLDDLETVKSFPQRYETRFGSQKIDVLMNNAGVAAIPHRATTKDGFERTFQSNHLGHFVLTAGVFPMMNHEKCRIINVSSIAHLSLVSPETRISGLSLENLNYEVGYEGWAAYGQTKLENILFTQELQRRAEAAGFPGVTAVVLHPGLVGTDIWRNTPIGLNKKNSSGMSIPSRMFYSAVRTTEQGANTQVWLAAGEGDDAEVKGQYFDEDQKVAKLKEYAKDEEKAKGLWELSDQFAGVKFRMKKLE
jgi:NAD(P)-dependent dehydrogenase (short-subunit alcohol dehydrogenase family)